MRAALPLFALPSSACHACEPPSAFWCSACCCSLVDYFSQTIAALSKSRALESEVARRRGVKMRGKRPSDEECQTHLFAPARLSWRKHAVLANRR